MNIKDISAKQKIKKALVSLMLHHPLDSITITDIVKEAKINRSSYYYHYYRKEEILEDIINHCSYDLIDRIKTSNANVTELKINQVVRPSSVTLFMHIYEQRDNYTALLNSELSLLFQNKFIDVIADYFVNHMIPIYATETNVLFDKEGNSIYQAYGILGMIKKWSNDGYEQSPMYMAKQLTYTLSNVLEKVKITI